MDISRLNLPAEVSALLDAAPKVTLATSLNDLIELSVRDADATGKHRVSYALPNGEEVLEAEVVRVRNGISANYSEIYMRRRDPDCMVIGDDRPTNKPHYRERFGEEFDNTRQLTFDWLKTQPLALLPFIAGAGDEGMPALAIVPDNAGFFALGLAMLQGICTPEQFGDTFEPKVLLYGAPPFRHTHFDGRQVVVHNRTEHAYELFSYNLYPGPSAKKGIYGVLLNLGVKAGWTTAHCSTVRVHTPYDNMVVFMHEGASGGGKSEMLEEIHRERDGRLLIGKNVVSGDTRHLLLPRGCDLSPVTDDMALCPPGIQKFSPTNRRLTVMDAEEAWFVRVNHIDRYGVDPTLESLCVQPPEPLLFLNIEAAAGSTALIWEHIQDEPGKPCPNPRVVIPRRTLPGIVNKAVTVDVRSLGVRTPPCTAESPSYGILGLFHILPPLLAWVWRLAAPRGHANPSIVDSSGLSSEGVGSYWPFATGKRVDHANILLRQIVSTQDTLFTLVPNQHVGAWNTSFMPQWIMREYLARRGSNAFAPKLLEASRCPLLGYALRSLQVEGTFLPPYFLRTELQSEVGTAGYDAGAKVLWEYFDRELGVFLDDSELHPFGRAIIEAALNQAPVERYEELLASAPTEELAYQQ